MPLTFDPIIAQLLDDLESRFKSYRKLSPLEMQIASGVERFRKVWERAVEQSDKVTDEIVYVGLDEYGKPISAGKSEAIAVRNANKLNKTIFKPQVIKALKVASDAT